MNELEQKLEELIKQCINSAGYRAEDLNALANLVRALAELKNSNQ